VREGRNLLFLKKKKQKDFPFLAPAPRIRVKHPSGSGPGNKSLFASFSSEKEERFP
jgi:hypothetical protein